MKTKLVIGRLLKRVPFSWYVVAVLLLQLFLLGQTQFIAWPELLNWPYLTSQGFEFYKDIVTIYPPLLPYLLQVFRYVFGWGVGQYQVVSGLVLLTSVVLTAHISKLLTQSKGVRVVGLLLLVLWQIRLEGFGLWFDHLMGLGLLICYWGIKQRHIKRASVGFTLAVLSKQTAVYSLLPIVITLFFSPHLLSFFLLTAINTTLFLGLTVPVNYYPMLWNQVITIGLGYLPTQVDQVQWPSLKQSILALLPAGSVFLALMISRKPLHLPQKNVITSLLDSPKLKLFCWAVAASLGVFTRFDLFHLQPALPFWSLLLMLLLSDMKKKLFWPAILIVLLNLAIFAEYFRGAVNLPPRFLDRDTVSLAEDVSQFIQNEPFYAYNTWEHLYFLTGTVPSTQYHYFQVPMFYKYPGLQEKTVQLLSQKPPLYILRGDTAQPPEHIDTYVYKHYQPVMVWNATQSYTLYRLR